LTKTDKALLIEAHNHGSRILYSGGRSEKDARRPYAVLDEKCLANGASAEGRMASFRHVLGVRQKAAVLISELSGEIWFPTVSMKAADCVWLNDSEILSVHAKGPHVSEVVFFDGTKRDLDVDSRTLRLQMKRCRIYLEKLFAQPA
jgi:competence transcription factor ComK